MRHQWGAYRWLLTGVLLAAWAARLVPPVAGSLHPDEALYAYWGRLIVSGQDPLLARVPVFKPPLLPYLVAGTQSVFGPLGVGLHLPGLAAGLLTVVLTAALARAQYRDKWLAGPAAIVVAFSPFSTQFSQTIFPDPLMVVLGVGACVAAARHRGALAGLIAGLAFAAKQTGLAWAPLVLVLLLIGESDNRRLGATIRFVAGFAAPFMLVYAWDAIRVSQGAPGFWEMGISGYGGLRLVWPHELTKRLAGWAHLASYLVASPLATCVLAVGVLVLGWTAARGVRHTCASLTDLTLLGFCTVLILLHWLAAFPVWDRYLLPLVPVLAVLVSRALSLVSRKAAVLVRWGGSPPWTARNRRVASMRTNLHAISVQVALILVLAVPATGASASAPPIGGDHGASQGMAEIAQYLSGLPEGSVVYHHWQGWHYRLYLFDVPLYLAYWPDPSWLADDVRSFGSTEPRYVAFPSGESTSRVADSLEGVGYGLCEELATRLADGSRTFTLYRIVPLGKGRCT